MVNTYGRAELLTALWKLSSADALPTSHGILDRALEASAESLPAQLREGLTFSVTGVGLRCLELPDIMLAAQDAMLTTEPNPTYQETIVTLDPQEARQIVLQNGLEIKRAREIGQALKAQVDSLKASEVDRADVVAA